MKPLPKCFRKDPKTQKEAKRRKLGYWSVRKGNVVYTYSKIFPKGIQTAKVSPKFPNESQSEMRMRLAYNVADKVSVATMLAMPEPKIEEKAVLPVPKFETHETYPKKSPDPRNAPTGHTVWYSSSGKPPVKLRGTTWKEIRAWASEMFDHFAERHEFLTASALMNYATHMKFKEDWRQPRLIRRIEAIFKPELLRERAEMQAMLSAQIAAAAPAENPSAAVINTPETAGANDKRLERLRRRFLASRRDNHKRDRFGNKAKTRCARVNACITLTPKSLGKIEEESGERKISSHLIKLIERGFVVKVAKKYKLAPGLKEEPKPKKRIVKKKTRFTAKKKNRVAKRPGKR